jgi:uncharacterized repeat protein (TIGR04076 family)
VIPEKGLPLKAEIISIKGMCNAGHCAGDAFTVSARNTNGMCGYLYHAAFPYILMLQFGGTFPWHTTSTVELECPDKANLVTLRLSVNRAAPVAAA